jgi:hypothetical protein
MTCDTYGHLVPGGNRQAVDRLDDGNRMKTFWTRECVLVYRKLLKELEPPAGVEPATY